MGINFSLIKAKLNRWVWALLSLSVGLSVFTYFNDDEVDSASIVMPTKQKKNAPPQHSAQKNKNTDKNSMPNTLTSALNRSDRALDNQAHKNLFKVPQWGADAKIKTPKLAKFSKDSLNNLQETPVPIAPPVPFIYVGKLENTPKGTVVYLQGNNKVYTVAKGEKIDPFWRFDDEFIVSLQLTYLPLNLSQVLLKTQQAVPDAPTNAFIK